MTVPEPDVDTMFDDPIDEPAPDCFDREWWVAYLRDLHDYDPEILSEKSDSWVWSRGLEVTDD